MRTNIKPGARTAKPSDSRTSHAASRAAVEPPAGTSAADFLPARRDLPALKKAAKHCQGCPLFARATQTVFGEGPASARLVLVGEQPGDVEDTIGRPFVGPAGKLLDRVLEEVGISRDDVYVTNAVKHFKWTPQGKRRLHGKPNAREIAACRPWLEAELEAIHPAAVVCLGASAAQALLGRTFRLTRQHGEPVATPWAPWTIGTYHPSAILRAMGTADGGATMLADFTADLRLAAKQLSRR